MNKTSIFGLLLIFLLASCVPSRQYEEIKSKKAACEKETTELKSANETLKTEKTELLSRTSELEKLIKSIETDTLMLCKSLKMMTKNYDRLNETYDMLLDKNNKLLAGSSEETKKLMMELQKTQENLQKKEDALKELERDLDLKKKNLDGLKSNLDGLNKELSKSKEDLLTREKKLAELEGILSRKDSIVNALKKKVSDALLGFENNGLTIQQKNGKVYVSLDESLLFASGSTNVESKGIEALKKLAKVLEQNQDISVLIEGHTDDVPMSGSGNIKSNWELSVLRATSIVKILTTNSKMDPSRLTAAGRGEYFPIDQGKTAESRRKNRRTEIILTPKLDELLKILETN